MHKWAAAFVVLTLFSPTVSYAQGGGAPSAGRGAGPGGAGRGAAGPVAGHGIEVPGWWARLDDPRQISEPMRFVPSGSGIHATTGPSAIFWNPQETGEGEYTVKATFALAKAPGAPDAYGLLIGGTDLGGDVPTYTEFLLRTDGKYAIRRRAGATVTSVGGEWADHAAIAKADATGKTSNELSVHMTPAGVTFAVNEMEIAKQPASAVDAAGMAGVRIGRGLDVQIDGFALESAPAQNTR